MRVPIATHFINPERVAVRRGRSTLVALGQPLRAPEHRCLPVPGACAVPLTIAVRHANQLLV